MYVVLGCGAIGAAVALRLWSSGKDVMAIDIDPARVESLRQQGVEARVGDAREIDHEALDGKTPPAFLLMGIPTDALEGSLVNISGKWPSSYILVRSKDRAAVRAIADMELKPDHIIFPEEIVTTAVLRQISIIEARRDSSDLVNALKGIGERGLAIFMHNNPDPDAMASAYGLARICEHQGVSSRTFYGGVIGHQENQAFVNLLGIEIVNVVDESEASEIVAQYDKIALVDCSAPGSNNVLPSDILPNIIIDHHITELDRDSTDFTLNIDAGSTATAITRLLRELEIEIDPILATALLYGIRSDTLAFTRGTTTSEFQSAAYLLPLADPELIGKIQSPRMTAKTMDVIGKAILNREIRGPYLLSCVEIIHDRDDLAQAADILMTLEGISTVLVFGIEENTIFISARSKDPRLNIGQILKKAFSDPGTAGGHASAAGAQLPMGIFGDVDEMEPIIELARAVVKKHFFDALGIHDEEGRKPE